MWDAVIRYLLLVRMAWTVGLGGAALLAVTTLGAPARPDVHLSALVIGASSTNPGGDGVADFYGGLFGQDPTVVANFLTGPPGIYRAIADNQDGTTVVLSSGWGAANASALLSYLQVTHDPTLADPTVFVLDNNVARPNGGFGTRYPVFALIGVNPVPAPVDPGVAVLDVGYEYDINGDTPAYVLNPVAMANSLATYFDNRLNQAGTALPVHADGSLALSATECDSVCHDGIDAGEDTTVHLDSGQTVVVKHVGDTTYVSYRRDGLPLLQPLRTYGGEVGKKIADATEPALKAVVDYGYPDNDALAGPDRYAPARLVPTPKETRTFVRQFTAGVRQGAQTLRGDSPVTTARATRHAAAPKRPVAKAVKVAMKRMDSLAKKLRVTNSQKKPAKARAGHGRD